MNLSAAFHAVTRSLGASSPAIAATILRQLGGMRRLVVMTGANNFIDHGNGVSFKFKGSRKWNYLHIFLDDDDTYVLEFAKLGGRPFYEKKKAKSISHIYADQLKRLIESETGLYLSL